MARSKNIDKRHPIQRLEDAKLLRTRRLLVGEKLRREYQDIADEPIPAEFIELLDKVDRRAKQKR